MRICPLRTEICLHSLNLFIILCNGEGELPKIPPICLWGMLLSNCWIIHWCSCWQIGEPFLEAPYDYMIGFPISHQLLISTCHITISPKWPFPNFFGTCCSLHLKWVYLFKNTLNSQSKTPNIVNNVFAIVQGDRSFSYDSFCL